MHEKTAEEVSNVSSHHPSSVGPFVEDVSSDATLIKYMTDGVLLRESLIEPDLDSGSNSTIRATVIGFR